MFVEEGCSADVKGSVGPSVSIILVPNGRTMIGNQTLRDLRALRSTKIPDGVEKIGDRWFAGSDIESVEIPASVREIGKEAFNWCR